MTNATSTHSKDLREQMISHIRTAGHLRSERIKQTFRTVPRHQFVPAASVEEAYANKAITIKPGADRRASCISVPTVVATMLDQLDPQPGEHVLGIGTGTGTGYNAALVAELVGPTGSVTTIDIHSDVTDHAPYDKIISRDRRRRLPGLPSPSPAPSRSPTRMANAVKNSAPPVTARPPLRPRPQHPARHHRLPRRNSRPGPTPQASSSTSTTSAWSSRLIDTRLRSNK
jgi:hypothetical protein